MKDFRIQEGDLLLAQDLILVQNIEQIVQSAKIILQTKLGDFCLEPNFGLDWTNLFAKKIVPDYVQKDMQNALTKASKQISGIEAMKLAQNRKTRELNVAFKLNLVTGEYAKGEAVLNA